EAKPATFPLDSMPVWAGWNGEEHMKVGPLAVERYAVSEPQQTVVRASVQKTLDQFWLAFDGIKRAFVDKDPLYARWRGGK
ncbi:MAG TPA: hypothetical protein VK200_08370, partial [Candidatus Limnocylindrales bacterium]|nr:hypothetical protein [Candidatus Limnocylindrales bacterium]